MRNLPDEMLAISVLISLEDSSGSGLIYKSEHTLYLVTAKHVLFYENGQLRKNEIEIVSQTADVNDNSVVRLRLDLKQLTSKYHLKTDVCIVKIGNCDNLENWEFAITYLPGAEKLEEGLSNPVLVGPENLSLLKEVFVSNDVYVFGYPTSLGLENNKQFDPNKPLIRKGIIANINESLQTLILDCPVYGGNSGGPVVEVFEKNNEKEFRVVGVVSQYIPYIQRWRNNRDKLEHIEYLNSGYSVATSFDTVIELINSLEAM